MLRKKKEILGDFRWIYLPLCVPVCVHACVRVYAHVLLYDDDPVVMKIKNINHVIKENVNFSKSSFFYFVYLLEFLFVDLKIYLDKFC